MMEREYLHGRAFVKKSKGKIQIFETPYGLGDFVPVVAEGTTKPRMLKDRFADVVNVKDFGAVGDGVTDDTKAIQAAFVYANGRSDAVVLFPSAHTYCISNEVQFGGDITVIAYGANFKAVGAKDFSYGMFSNWLDCEAKKPTKFSGHSNISWFGGNIDCGGLSTLSSTYRWAMNFAHGENIQVWYVTFTGARRVHTAELSACKNASFHYCNFFGQFPPVLQDYYPEVIQVDANTTSSSDRNPDQTCCENVGAYNCLFTNSEGTAEQTETSPYCGFGSHGTVAGQTLKNITVHQCEFRGIRRTAVTGTSSNIDGYRITENRFSGCGKNAIELATGAVDGTESLGNYVITDNRFDESGDASIRITGSTSNYLENVTIRDNLSTGLDAFAIVQRCRKVDIAHNRHSLSSDSPNSTTAGIYTNDVFPLVVDDFHFYVGGYASKFNRAVTASTGSTNARIAHIYTDLVEPVTVVNTTVNGIDRIPELGASYKAILGATADSQANTSVPAITLRSSNVYNAPQIGYQGSEGFRVASYKTNAEGKSVLEARVLYISPSSSGGNFGPGDDGARKCGFSSNRWSEIFAVTGAVNTSDEREKTAIVDPDDALMRAWSKVAFKAFQFKDAVEKKGADARLHVGVIAQQVIEAFASEGLDATRYGLLCYDKWEDEYEDVEVIDAPEIVADDGTVTPAVTHVEHRLVTPAGDRYGIRYEEALALEAAYQRWKLQKIEATLVTMGVKL